MLNLFDPFNHALNLKFREFEKKINELSVQLLMYGEVTEIEKRVDKAIANNENIRYFGSKLNDEIKSQIKNILLTENDISEAIKQTNEIARDNYRLSLDIKRLKEKIKYLNSMIVNKKKKQIKGKK